MWEAWKKVDSRDDEFCEECGKRAVRIISRQARPVVYEYYSESLDAYITGPQQKSRILKEKDISEVG